MSGAITIMITTHPFVPNFAGEVDFSPDKLGPVTTFRAHSGSYDTYRRKHLPLAQRQGISSAWVFY